MRLKTFTFLSFLFFFIPISLAQTLYAGSSLDFNFSYINATISIYCKDKIANNEFIALPNCTTTLLNNTIQKIHCVGANYLKIVTNPASNNSCTFFITYWQKITMPEKVVETHYTSSTVALQPQQNITIINRTIVQPIKEVVREVEKTKYVENTTKIQQLQKTINKYEERLNEYKKSLSFFQSIFYGFGVALAVLGIHIFMKRKEIMQRRENEAKV